jgi:branched-chain amino acid aminotransferase
VFLCGTAAKVAMVSKVENYKIPHVPGPITTKIKEELTAITQGQRAEYRDWITTVKF